MNGLALEQGEAQGVQARGVRPRGSRQRLGEVRGCDYDRLATSL